MTCPVVVRYGSQGWRPVAENDLLPTIKEAARILHGGIGRCGFIPKVSIPASN
jgi:hypothetical protein